MKIYTLVEDYSDYESPFLAQHGVSFLIEKTGKESSSTSARVPSRYFTTCTS
ncbi:hypothetical protein [Thermococcus sp. GR6]|uniref:hypothetical protein n=1 Tax=Thermococcus sp. GR6 TaxID=1638256 RepID=UPI001F0F31EA|nr:hypothetical protein [Thermococcus sp. GR6]